MTNRLDALFDDIALQKLPLRDRIPVTRRLEAALDAVIDAVGCDLVVEVGAFEGDFARRVKARHPAATVIAYEANPRVYARFAPAHAASGVDYRPKAIADRGGTIAFNIQEVVAGHDMPHENRMGSIHQLAFPGSKALPVEVPVARLDDELAGVRGARACLWIDVEGAVADVIAGAPDTLARSAIVYCEVESRLVWRRQVLAERIVETLAQAGFAMVARDCQKWFQKNCLFLRADLAARDDLRAIVAAYEAEVEAAFTPAAAAFKAAGPV